MPKNLFEKCKTCENLDKDKSNKNWLVCKIQPMPMDIVINGADNCKNFKADKPAELKG